MSDKPQRYETELCGGDLYGDYSSMELCKDGGWVKYEERLTPQEQAVIDASILFNNQGSQISRLGLEQAVKALQESKDEG